jgi:ATP-dependent 26S proteasome regulatory subunit
MRELSAEEQRAANLWEAYLRKLPPMAKACSFDPSPHLTLSAIGGLASAKEEILTYACAATDPDVYRRWGTAPPTGLVLIGPPGSGKRLLAKALATQTGMAFLEINVPRLIRQLLHAPPLIGELLNTWAPTLAELPAVTVFFGELDFAVRRAGGGPAADIAIASILDFLLELIDRTVVVPTILVVGSTSHPDTLPAPFLEAGRLERVVEVVPVFPDDVVASLQIASSRAEKGAGRTLFGEVDWKLVVGKYDDVSIGEWLRILDAVLRTKARCEAANEPVEPVTTEDLRFEVERTLKAKTLLPKGTGRYL